MRYLALAALFLSLNACGSRYLSGPNIDSEATIRRSDEAEAIVNVVRSYVRSIERFDLRAIDELVAADYYENAGTTDTTADDYGREGVLEMLSTLREHVETINMDLAIRDLVIQDDRADVICEYTFRMRYQVGENARWETQRDVSRIQLRRIEDQWLISSGL